MLEHAYMLNPLSFVFVVLELLCPFSLKNVHHNGSTWLNLKCSFSAYLWYDSQEECSQIINFSCNSIISRI